ncbi:hypothetical protein [Terasakiella pusilla]|uniref:hypothetical protein n=1 Tax=Terasakiella pusilla TaxID=64973 RepID=UPI003AA8A3DB
MTPEQMDGYGLTTLAVWPEPWHENEGWLMHEYKVKKNGELQWYVSYVPTESGHVKASFFNNFDEASKVANSKNEILKQELQLLNLSPELLRSYELKAEKAITAKSRLAHEERLMLAEAIKKWKNAPPVSPKVLDLPPPTEEFREQLATILNTMPYLDRVILKNGAGQRRIIFRQGSNLRWSKPYDVTKRNARFAYRAKIANGFDLRTEAHWGKTKAAIRQLLLPRANELLQLSHVRQMLDEELSQGRKVLVAGSYVFWYEDDGQIGWQVKIRESSASSKGVTLWREGTILSKNHGRLVILPYIKENGEFVKGHTKNAPNDGKAKPRHKNHYIELPFEVLSDDLMIGLFGELPYE